MPRIARGESGERIIVFRRRPVTEDDPAVGVEVSVVVAVLVGALLFVLTSLLDSVL